MGAVRLLVLGVGDAFSARSYSSCLAVETEGVWLLIDCPHPIRKMMHEASIAAGIAFDVGDVAALVLTHLHADHASGVEGIAFFARYMLDRRLPLLAHPDVLADLWPRHLAGGHGAESPDGRIDHAAFAHRFRRTAAVDHGCSRHTGAFYDPRALHAAQHSEHRGEGRRLRSNARLQLRHDLRPGGCSTGWPSAI